MFIVQLNNDTRHKENTTFKFWNNPQISVHEGKQPFECSICDYNVPLRETWRGKMYQIVFRKRYLD